MLAGETTAVVTAVAVLAALAGSASAALAVRTQARATTTSPTTPGRQLRPTAVVLGVLAAGAVVGLALVGLVALGILGVFGVLHLAYLGVVVTLPLLGLALLALVRRRGAAGGTVALAALLLVPAPIGVYATHVEPAWLRVDHHVVAVDPAAAGDDPVRIGVLADLQTNGVGDAERTAVRRLVDAAPDLILVPGDLFQGTDQEFDAGLDDLRAVLAELEAPAGVLFVRGDVDPGDRADRAFAGTEVVILDDRAVDVEVGDRRLRIGGTRLDFASAAATAVRDGLASAPDGGEVRILMSHRPDTIFGLPPASRVDLTVAGHTHGGQVVLPGFGPLLTLSDVPRQVARGGLHSIDRNPIYVSPGVGLERSQAPQVRLFNRPAIAILELTG